MHAVDRNGLARRLNTRVINLVELFLRIIGGRAVVGVAAIFVAQINVLVVVVRIDEMIAPWLQHQVGAERWCWSHLVIVVLIV